MLEDRIRFFEGRPQRYGTQLDCDAEGNSQRVDSEVAVLSLDMERWGREFAAHVAACESQR